MTGRRTGGASGMEMGRGPGAQLRFEKSGMHDVTAASTVEKPKDCREGLRVNRVDESAMRARRWDNEGWNGNAV